MPALRKAAKRFEFSELSGLYLAAQWLHWLLSDTQRDFLILEHRADYPSTDDVLLAGGRWALPTTQGNGSGWQADDLLACVR